MQSRSLPRSCPLLLLTANDTLIGRHVGTRRIDSQLDVIELSIDFLLARIKKYSMICEPIYFSKFIISGAGERSFSLLRPPVNPIAVNPSHATIRSKPKKPAALCKTLFHPILSESYTDSIYLCETVSTNAMAIEFLRSSRILLTRLVSFRHRYPCFFAQQHQPRSVSF